MQSKFVSNNGRLLTPAFSCLIASFLIATASASPQLATTATFENLQGQFLGFSPYTDPLSKITLSNINGFGLGADLFNSASFPSLYQQNTVLIQNSPQSLGVILWSYNFSVHGILPTTANQLSTDILYSYGTPDIFTHTSGTVTLKGYGSQGQLIGSVSTPTITSNGDQTSLSTTFSSPISSFDIVASGLNTDYDNITFSTVQLPEPAPGALVATALAIPLLFSRMARRRPVRR